MDSIVHGIAKSQTRLNDFHLHYFLWEDHMSWILLNDPAFYAFF